jgi:sugar phosphate isomerase/epimerase
MDISASTQRVVPVGLELWTVRTHLNHDLRATVTAVAEMGYQSVEFYSTYLDWTPAGAADVRALLDDLGLTCASTHNGLRAFTAEALPATVELNRIVGSRLLALASVPPVPGLDGWRRLAEQLTGIAGRLRPFGMSAGFHNHQREWTPIDGTRPIDLLARNTPPDLVLQLDVGSCVEAGADPVAFINRHPGRVRSLHCKDWSAAAGYAVAFGEGDCPWPGVFDAAASAGGVEAHIIEQGHSTPDEEFAMARRGLDNWKRLQTTSDRVRSSPRA